MFRCGQVFAFWTPDAARGLWPGSWPRSLRKAKSSALIEKMFFGVVDPLVGRKCFSMFYRAGLIDVSVAIEDDATFTVAGPIDADRRRNWEDQMQAAFPATVKIFGSEMAATHFTDRFLAHQDRPDTMTSCLLYFVRGRVPS